MHNIKFTTWTILSAQFNGIKYTHSFVQPSPLSVSRIFLHLKLIMFLRFIHIVACIRILTLCEAVWYSTVTVCPFYLPVYPLVETWIVSIFWLLWIMLLWTLGFSYLFKILLSILLGIHLEVEFLGHVVIPCLTFLWTHILFWSIDLHWGI